MHPGILREASPDLPTDITNRRAHEQCVCCAAEAAIADQRASFQRWGVMADWDNAYLTMNPEYEAAQLRVFAEMLERGRIFRGLRPVYWSPSSVTALAEAELEYPEGHV
eukprot:9418037-Pyramimonas_sp.AAC.2